MIGVVGTGQVAQHVIAELKAREIPHVIYTRSSPMWDSGVFSYTTENIVEQIQKHRVTRIINCAALRDIAVCEKNPHDAWLANVDLPKIIGEVAKQIYISTDYVFDLNEDARTLHEDAESRGALSIYGQTKLEGERVVLMQGGAVVRISSPFGVYPSPMKPHFVDFVSRKYGEIDLPTDQFFRVSYLPDVAKVLVDLALDEATTGVYHAVNEGTATWVEIARHARKLNRNNGKITGSMRWDKTRPMYGALKNTRLPRFRHWTEAMDEYFRGTKAEERIER